MRRPKFLPRLLPAFAAAGVCGSLLCGACASEKPDLVFANFESYMSPDLISQVYADPRFAPVQFDYYQTNEDMIANFRNGTYGVGAPSLYTAITLQREGILHKLDWSRFGLKAKDGSPIETADQALSLFIPNVQQALLGYDLDGDGQKDNLLNYCVPYFFQSFVFAYRGDEIPALAPDRNPTVKDIVRAVAADPRFKNGHLAAVEDDRMLFSLARIMQTQDEAGTTPTVNPDPSVPKPSIDDYIGTYENLSDAGINAQDLNSDPSVIFLNSDSTVVLNALAAPVDDSGAYPTAGAFMFNGDAIFAARGGEYQADKPDSPNGQDYHIVTPQYMPLALDALVMSQKIADDPELEDRAYDLMNKICLEGADSDAEAMRTLAPGTKLYKYGPMLNFDFVQYVSPLQVISGQTDSVVADGYFSSDDPSKPDDKDLLSTIIGAYNITVPNGSEGRQGSEAAMTSLLEAPVNAWQKQAMTNAYLRFKDANWA